MHINVVLGAIWTNYCDLLRKSISPLTLYSSLEESLARFTRGNPVMETARNVTANKAKPPGYHIFFLNAVLQKRQQFFTAVQI